MKLPNLSFVTQGDGVSLSKTTSSPPDAPASHARLSSRKREAHGAAPASGVRPEYTAWKHMRHRCGNPRHPNYKHYGGRGIVVCAEWELSFAAFIRDVGLRPSPQHSIDRIDNNGNYEPGNVRWATATEQIRNSRRAKLTVLDVTWIRMWVGLGFTHREVANAFNIDKSAISRIANRKVWR